MPALSEMDGCLTKAYDVRLAGQDPLPVIEGCRYAGLHQFTLDCAKGFTDELYRLTRLSFSPIVGLTRREMETTSRLVREACTRSPELLSAPVGPPVGQPVGQPPISAPASPSPPPAVLPKTEPAKGG